MKATVAILLIGAAWWSLFAPDGQRIGSVREGPDGSVDVFDQASRRIGWGRRNPNGSVELFDQRGNRIGEARGGRIVVCPPRNVSAP